MAEGLRGMRGPLYNADDYPSLLMLLIMTARQAEADQWRKTHKHWSVSSVCLSKLHTARLQASFILILFIRLIGCCMSFFLNNL